MGKSVIDQAVSKRTGIQEVGISGMTSLGFVEMDPSEMKRDDVFLKSVWLLVSKTLTVSKQRVAVSVLKKQQAPR